MPRLPELDKLSPCSLVLLTCLLLAKCSTALPVVVPPSAVLKKQTPKILSCKYSQEEMVVLAFLCISLVATDFYSFAAEETYR